MDRGLRGANAVVATTAGIMAVGIFVVYMLVSRHLRSIEVITLTLSESLGERVEKQAKEIAALQAVIENGTRSASIAMSDPLSAQAEMLREMMLELRNSSRAMRSQMLDQSVSQEQQMKDLADALHSKMALALSPPTPSRGPNLTVLIAAGLRLQKRMHEDLEKLMDQVSSKDQDSPGLLLGLVSAMKKQSGATRAVHDSLDSLAEKLDQQSQEQRNIDSAKDKRMISVLRALVTYLKVKENKPARDEEDQARMEEMMATVLSEVRNKTTFWSLLRTMRAQTAIMKRLGERVGGLEEKILRIQLGGGGGGGEGEEGDGGGGRGSKIAAATAAAITDTQNLLQILTREVQKQSESISDLQGSLSTAKEGTGSSATPTAPEVQETLGLAKKAQGSLSSLQSALDEQSLVLRRIDVRLSVLESKVKEERYTAGATPSVPAEVTKGQEKAASGEKQAVEEGASGKGDGGEGGQVDEEVKRQEDVAAGEVLQAVEDVITAKDSGASEVKAPMTDKENKANANLADQNLWTQHSFAGNDAFTRFSGYRLNARKFMALGLGATALQETRKVSDCKWAGKGGTMFCTAELSYGLAKRNNRFEAVGVQADFKTDIPSKDGFLSIKIDRDTFVLYREKDKEFPALKPGPNFPAKISMCPSPDVGGVIPPRILREFVTYHQFLGIQRFHFYAVGQWTPSSAEKHFELLMKSGDVTFTDFTGINRYDMAHQGDVLALQDCVYRNTYQSQWVATAELSEFLQVKVPPGTLPSLLDKHKGVPWLSLGSLWWSVQKCCPDYTVEGDKFSMERMVYHWPGPLCHDQLAYPDSTMCLGSVGYRKMILDPRQVVTFGPHYAATDDGGAKGLDLSTNVAVVNHMQHYMKNMSMWCSETLPSDKSIEWWVKDTSFSKLLQSHRKGRKCNFAVGGCLPQK